MKQITHIYTTIITVLLTISASAQAMDKPEMADVMRSNGKIYVVVVVAALVFIGITIYLINLERRIKTLEKEQK